jgi:surface polysaccharide O-acyltransferase-like enzyme
MKSPALNRGRIFIIDAIRGLAIALMIIDHSLFAIETIGIANVVVEYSRLSITRFSMPLFMIASGFIWALYGLRIKRWIQVFILSILINLTIKVLWPDFNNPEILLVWTILAIASRLIVRFPITVMIIGYTQFIFWIVPWSGYQPGELAIFLGVGVLIARAPLDKTWKQIRFEKLLSAFAFLGRYPLSIYSGHLISISLIVALVNK